MVTDWDEQHIRDGKPNVSILLKAQSNQDHGDTKGSGETVSDPRMEV